MSCTECLNRCAIKSICDLENYTIPQLTSLWDLQHVLCARDAITPPYKFQAMIGHVQHALLWWCPTRLMSPDATSSESRISSLARDGTQEEQLIAYPACRIRKKVGRVARVLICNVFRQTIVKPISSDDWTHPTCIAPGYLHTLVPLRFCSLALTTAKGRHKT